MIQRIEINSIHFKADEKLKKYIEKKIGSLDKYLPHFSRSSAHVEVRLSESNTKDKSKRFVCETILTVPSEAIAVKEASSSMQSAVDIVEDKLKNQIHDYKDKHSAKFRTRKVRLSRIISKIRSR